MDTGRHVKASEYESVYDSAKKMWAERVTEVNLVSSGEVDSSEWERMYDRISSRSLMKEC